MKLAVQDLVHECGHIIRAEPPAIEQFRKEFESGSRTCSVCEDKNGKKKFMLRTWKCATCNQTQEDKAEHLCFCKKNDTIKIIYDPKFAWMARPNESLLDKNREDDIMLAKSQRLYKKRLEKERQKPNERADEIVNLLKQNNENQKIIIKALDKEESVIKNKEMNNSAIG